jgi:lipopolysaccharide/colanic/teichoic acid biosynthesis glycosyltransferase
MRQASRRQARHVLGIRTTPTRAEPVAAGDRTLHGTYWFDLRTRRPAAAVTKRVIDVIGSLTLIVIFAPLMILIIAAIRIASRGPAVFVQRRIGFRCGEFGMYKFRTMVVSAESLQQKLAEESGSEFFKLPNDPRVTPIGRFLRRFSLDELPQLFNVLEGTMSLVGPRPLLLSDLEKFPLRGQMRRFSVRPGLTGLWQVSGRSLTTDEERMKLDREYVNHWSLWLDFTILLRTIGAVLTGRGAT